MSKRKEREIEIREERKVKQARLGFKVNESKWSKVPIDLLNVLCQKATGDSCQSHAEFAQVCKSFHTAAQKPTSWSGKMNFLVERVGNEQHVQFYSQDKWMNFNDEFMSKANVHLKSVKWTKLSCATSTKTILSKKSTSDLISLLSQPLSGFNFSMLEKLECGFYFIPPLLIQQVQEGKCPHLTKIDLGTNYKHNIRPLLTENLTSATFEISYGKPFPDQTPANLPRLKELEIKKAVISETFLLDFSSCKNLTSLKLMDVILMTAPFETMKQLQLVEFQGSVESATLLLQHCPAPKLSLFFEGDKNLSELFFQALSIAAHSHLTDLFLQVTALPMNCSLFKEAVGLKNMFLQVQDFSQVETIAFPRELETLELDSIEDDFGGPLWTTAIAECPNLKRLELSHFLMTPDGFQSMNNLQTLVLDHFALDPHYSDVKIITLPTSLTRLDLNWPKFSVMGSSYVPQILANFTNRNFLLKELQVQYDPKHPVTDNDTPFWEMIYTMNQKQLDTLTFLAIKFDRRVIESMEVTRRLKNLKTLRIDYDPEVEEQVFQLLKQGTPYWGNLENLYLSIKHGYQTYSNTNLFGILMKNVFLPNLQTLVIYDFSHRYNDSDPHVFKRQKYLKKRYQSLTNVSWTRILPTLTSTYPSVVRNSDDEKMNKYYENR